MKTHFLPYFSYFLWHVPVALVLVGLPAAVFAAVKLEAEHSNMLSVHLVLGVLGALLFAAVVVFFKRNHNASSQAPEIGFYTISPSVPQKFYPLHTESQSFTAIHEKLSCQKLKIYSDTEKIIIKKGADGNYVIEDNNTKNSLLVNKRRARRHTLCHADIIDTGQLTIMFSHPKQSETTAPKPITLKVPSVGGSATLLPNTPCLVSQKGDKVLFLSKNKVFIGKSDSNDLTIKSASIDWRHAMITKIADCYKITRNSTNKDMFINHQRVNEKVLKEGDEIGFDQFRYTFTYLNQQ